MDDATLILIDKRGMEISMLPNDPVMLLSFVNLKLRDYYASLDAMCEDMDVDKQEILEKLATIDYHYDSAGNRFV